MRKVILDTAKTPDNAQYQGYGQEPQHTRPLRPSSDRATLNLEREMMLQEYQCDREAILSIIKDALKNRQYQEAQEYVYKYRVAAKTDEEFAVLARMTAQGLEKYQEISKLVTALEATPEDDYRMRMGLCERILKVQPENETYKKELKRCQKALGIKPGAGDAVLMQNGHPVEPQTQSTTGKIAKGMFWAALIFNCIIMIAVADEAITSAAMMLGMGLMVALTVFQAFIYWPRKNKPAYSGATLFGKIFLSFSAWLIIMAIMATSGSF